MTNIKWEETSKEKDSGSQGQKKDESTVEPWLNALRKVPKSAGLGEWDQAVVLRVSPDSAKIGLVDGSTGYLYLKETLWAAPCLVNQYLGPTPRYMKEILKVGDVVAVSPKASEHFRLEQIPNVTGALVAMDPKTGRVLALTGGYDFDLNQFNCATQARRQPGSCFKPFVYLVGLEKGLTPESKILDAPISISLGRGRGYYTPQNYGHQYLGLCSLKTGLEQSRNVMTVRLAQQVGINRIINCARDFGIMENMPKQIAMVLGAGATTVMRMASAYSAIANGGYKVTPYFVDWVQDRYGETLYNHQSIPQPKTQLASPQSIEQLTNMLIGVTQNGTARSLSDIGFTVAGKTGTTNNYNDAWFVGFTKDVVVAVFVGFPTPRTLGENETGGRVAIPIFRQFMTRIYDGKVTKTFDISPSILSKQTKDISIDEEPYILEDANDKTLQIVANTSEDEVVIYQE